MRLRVLVVLVGAIPVGWAYLARSLNTGENIIRRYRGGFAVCDREFWGGEFWRGMASGCRGSTAVAWVAPRWPPSAP